MNRLYPTIAFRSALLLALLVSSALYIHYMAPAGTGFCGAHSGCEAVRLSAYSHIVWEWLTVPLVGILAFTTVFAASLLPATYKHARALAVVGGVVATVLLLVQGALVQAFCWMCVVVDVSAIAAALASLWWLRSEPREPLKLWAWLALAGMAIASPILWSVAGSNIPPEISRMYVPGKINVVEYADFECPYCRKAHPIFKDIIASYGDRVMFRRVNMPLAHRHPFAVGAAKAAICAKEQGKEEQMADILFTVELSDSTGVRAAEQLGLDMARFEQCSSDPKTDAALEAEIDLVDRTGLEGLPTAYIGNQRIVGLRSEEEYRDAFDKAAQGSDGGVQGLLYVGLWVAAAGLVTFLGRVSPGLM